MNITSALLNQSTCLSLQASGGSRKSCQGRRGPGIQRVPVQGVKMSSKPSKWLFDITGADTNGTRESFLSLDFFLTYVKNIFLASYGRRSPPSRPMDPPLLQARPTKNRENTHTRIRRKRQIQNWQAENFTMQTILIAEHKNQVILTHAARQYLHVGVQQNIYNKNFFRVQRLQQHCVENILRVCSFPAC